MFMKNIFIFVLTLFTISRILFSQDDIKLNALKIVNEIDFSILTNQKDLSPFEVLIIPPKKAKLPLKMNLAEMDFNYTFVIEIMYADGKSEILCGLSCSKGVDNYMDLKEPMLIKMPCLTKEILSTLFPVMKRSADKISKILVKLSFSRALNIGEEKNFQHLTIVTPDMEVDISSIKKRLKKLNAKDSQNLPKDLQQILERNISKK